VLFSTCDYVGIVEYTSSIQGVFSGKNTTLTIDYDVHIYHSTGKLVYSVYKINIPRPRIIEIKDIERILNEDAKFMWRHYRKINDKNVFLIGESVITIDTPRTADTADTAETTAIEL